MKLKESILISALGILLGVLGTCIVFKATDDRKFDGDYGRWRKLFLVLQQVEKHYVDTIDRKGMTDAAIEAALAKLDPHSVYLPPVELESSESELAGNFEGIGIQFNVPNDTAIVLSVIPGGPSEKAGLLPGDRIMKVDEKDMAGVKMPQDSMVRRMKGPSGSKVRIMVRRDGAEIPFDITRGRIPVNSVDASFMVNDTTGYIRLSKFTRTTYMEFMPAADNLLSQGMKRMIFDLRDNTGGYLDQALLLADQFLEKGDTIVYMEGLHRKREEYLADGRGKLRDVALTVLINENSASSSEIFAGAIQDNDRGVTAGRRSFGKGLVQEPVNFTDGSGIRLTVARFHTPSGRCIQKPYSDDYSYDIYDRYVRGEMTSADSMKVDRSVVYHTRMGREVYGGGGIAPDIFIPMDTTRATSFYVECNRKAVQMRFASRFFDLEKATLPQISTMGELDTYMKARNVERRFLDYASSCGIAPGQGEWEESRSYMMPQIKALVGRYSNLGEEAFYRYYLEIDDTFLKALESPSTVGL